jgi:hypothetical protein
MIDENKTEVEPLPAENSENVIIVPAPGTGIASFTFEPNSRYDVILIDLVAGDVPAHVLFTNAADEKLYHSYDVLLIKKVEVLKEKNLIGDGKEFPASIATFGTKENMQLKLLALPGMA